MRHYHVFPRYLLLLHCYNYVPAARIIAAAGRNNIRPDYGHQ